MMPLEDQIAAVLELFPGSEITGPTELAIPLFPKAVVLLNFAKYPKKPKIRFPRAMEKAIGDIEAFLPAYNKWEKGNPLEFVHLLTAVRQTVETLAAQVVHLSDKIVEDICYIARSAGGNEMFCVLRLVNGLLKEFVLAPGLASSSVAAVFSPSRMGRDPTLVASCHSHPSGNNRPSEADLQTFSRYRINMILGAPYTANTLGVYSPTGAPVEFQIHSFDPFWNET